MNRAAAPPRRRGPGRPRKVDLDEGAAIPTLADDALMVLGNKLPNRYWLRSERGWYSVPRGSAAHKADRELRGP